jgi:photosystem II stability/assembly factor-like uncharacterized protein
LLSFRDISFADQKHGWATGFTGGDGFDELRFALASTSDGGLTWRNVAEQMPCNACGVAVKLFSADVGVWNACVPFTTSDGGKRWTRASISGARAAQVGYASLAFANEDVGWIGGCSGGEGSGRIIAKTTDGGRTWHEQVADMLEPNAAVGSVAAASKTDAYALSDGLWATHDGGDTWGPVNANVGTRDFIALSFADALTGWAVDKGGGVFATKDGGRTWTVCRKGSATAEGRVWWYAIDFVNARDGWVVGPKGLVLHTTDGGRAWSQVAAGTTVDLQAVDFIDAEHGCVAGLNGACRRTLDGGRHWSGNRGTDVTAHTKEFVRQVAQILKDSKSGRDSASAAVAGTYNYSVRPEEALRLINKAIANRKRLLEEAQSLLLPEDPKSVRLGARLAEALEQSLADDERYRTWIKEAAAAFAAGAATAPATPELNAAVSNAPRVNATKKDVAGLMNDLCKACGLPGGYRANEF